MTDKKEKIIKVTKKEHENLMENNELKIERSRLILVLSQIHEEWADSNERTWNRLSEKYKLDRTKELYYDTDEKKIYQKEIPKTENDSRIS